MKLLKTLVIAAALTGCTRTISGFHKEPPLFELISEKKPDAVLGCFTATFERRHIDTSYRPLPNGGSVTLDLVTMLISTGQKAGMVDAEAVDGHTRVRVYGIFQGKFKRQMLEDATACL